MREPLYPDAIVVVPGVMGSELIDEQNRQLWGLNPAQLARAWVTGGYDGLSIRRGFDPSDTGVRATRLLRVPAYMPFLGGLEPYGRILRHLQALWDPRAVLEFPYDWRLPAASHGTALAEAAQVHLLRWRDTVRAARPDIDADGIKLVVVAHSMGGLVTLAALSTPGFSEIIRRVISLGTPYFGSVNALSTLADGGELPHIFPHRAARDLARTCPGVYDLLPRYVCVTEGDGRLLSPNDVQAIGASYELAADAADRWERLGLREPGYRVPLSAIVGIDQPTFASFRLSGHRLELFESALDDDPDAGGDGTVPRRCASPLGVEASGYNVRHGALARADSVLRAVNDILLQRSTGPRLDVRPLSAEFPHLPLAGHALEVRVREVGEIGRDPGASAFGIAVTSEDLATNKIRQWRIAKPRPIDGGSLVFTVDGLPPHLHRITVDGGGSPLTEIILVAREEQG